MPFPSRTLTKRPIRAVDTDLFGNMLMYRDATVADPGLSFPEGGGKMLLVLAFQPVNLHLCYHYRLDYNSSITKPSCVRK